MRCARHNTVARGLVLAELAAAVAVLTVLTALLFVAAKEGRRQASLADDFANLHRFAAGTVAYAADHDERVWGFSWRKGVDYGFGGQALSDLQAAANQAVDIIRRRGGRPDIGVITNWAPHILYTPLVLADYLEEQLPARWIVSPEDHIRLRWQSDPHQGFFALGPTERPAGTDNAAKRWPYSSGYRLTPAFWSPDATTAQQQTAYQMSAQSHNSMVVPQNGLDQRRLTEVAFPAQKVMVHDVHQRHFGPRQAYFAYAEARVPVLLADGSASVRRTSDANLGFNPDNPLSPSQTRTFYEPAAWEPRTLDGSARQLVTMHYMWTRSGLRGRDFGGPEVPWVD